MEYQINQNEFKNALETVGKIGEYTDHDVVSYYHDRSDDYIIDSIWIKDTWEQFLSYELRHMLARIGFQKALSDHSNIETTIRGLNEDIDWVSFDNPWGQRVGIQLKSIDKRLIVRGLRPHYDWVTLTTNQYDRAPSDTIVGAAKIWFRDWGDKSDIYHPEPLTKGIHYDQEKKEINLEHESEIKERLREADDYGEYVVYKFNKELEWIRNFNFPVKIRISGLNKITKFREYDDSEPEEFTADYVLPVSELKSDKSAFINLLSETHTRNS